jgi:spore coat protein A, manganese oxidase
VHDAHEEALPLPAGERDIPLMICDRAFAADGSFRYPSIDPSLHGEPGVTGGYMRGVLGDVILVNGAPWPVLPVSSTRYRLSGRHWRRMRRPPRSARKWTQAWAEPGAPEPLPMPLQNLLVSEAHRRLMRSGRPDVQPMPVGQIVGRMNEVRPVAELIKALLQEVDDALTRLDRLR